MFLHFFKEKKYTLNLVSFFKNKKTKVRRSRKTLDKVVELCSQHENTM